MELRFEEEVSFVVEAFMFCAMIQSQNGNYI